MIVALRSVHIERLVFIAEFAALPSSMVMVDRQPAAFSSPNGGNCPGDL
jgi:hypothetical protein